MITVAGQTRRQAAIQAGQNRPCPIHFVVHVNLFRIAKYQRVAGEPLEEDVVKLGVFDEYDCICNGRVAGQLMALICILSLQFKRPIQAGVLLVG